MEKIDKLLELLDQETKDCNAWNEDRSKPSDRALFHLLKRDKDNLPELNDYFHKAFRQTDVLEDGNLDSAIWHLLSDSTLFWRLFERVQGEKKI